VTVLNELVLNISEKCFVRISATIAYNAEQNKPMDLLKNISPLQRQRERAIKNKGKSGRNDEQISYLLSSKDILLSCGYSTVICGAQVRSTFT
jgi:hypothetical protein